MAKTLQLTFADRVGDALFIMLLRAGVKIGTMSLLTMHGRKSGQPRTVPVLLVEQEGERFLVACGTLTLGFALGLRRVLHAGKGAAWGPLLLGVFGLLLILAGIFVTDPGQGYPVGVAPLAHPTGHGIIHALCGLAIFVTLPIATFVMTRRFAGDPRWRGWALYSLLTGLIMIASFVLSQWLGALDQNGTIQNAPMGLVQRVGIIAGWVWVSLLAIALLRKGRAGSADSH